ncbi:hypothetical protein NKH18_47870 [Streptomyces sp. M10(2022)]
MAITVRPEELTDYLIRLYLAAGMTRRGARTVAAAQIEADLRALPATAAGSLLGMWPSCAADA